MKKIMFSAVFGTGNRPERIQFLNRVKKELDSQVEFVVFNTSGVVETDFPVVNAVAGLNPKCEDPLKELEALLKAHCPDRVRLLMDHARGELGFRYRIFERNIHKHVRLIKAFICALDEHKPCYVYLWNQFNVLHRTFEAILQRRDIKIGFFHDGVLPGSIAIDVDAEMGEGWIAREPERFVSVEVSEEDISKAEEYLQSLVGTENNRHPQDEKISVVDALKLSKLDDRPLVFFAGQNDWHAGIKPKSPARVFHSPVFEGSFEALVGLDEMAGELGVAILFKPHPLSRDRFAFLRADEFPNTLILQNTCINACIRQADVVVTIASQACYSALLENCAVVMLGRNQVTGKGLTYDVTSRDTMAKTVQDALRDPLRANRRREFAVHCAQLERSYLFDYGIAENDFYRRDARHAARLMMKSLSESTEDVIETLISGDNFLENLGSARCYE